jgi:O-antigen ligase/polysaccharide polymerase Wzy-like membrane protein
MSAVPAEIASDGRGGRFALPVRARGGAAFAACATVVAALGVESGGYYPTAWGITTVAALAIAAVAAVRTGGVRAHGPFLAVFAASTAWVALETTRAGAATQGVPEVERDILYLAVAWAALELLHRRTGAAALAGVGSAICALVLDGLFHLLLPLHIAADAYEGRLLFRPLGYANACGALAAIGVVIALGAAARSRAAAIALVPLVLGLALSGSRGAALALLVGLAAAAALHPERGRLAGSALALLPVPAALALFALRSHVTDVSVSSAVVAHDCVVVAAATCIAVGVQAVLAVRLRRILVPVGPVAVAAVALAAAAVAGAALRLGDRSAYWHVAWLDVRSHPLLGSGPGTFAREWLAHRTVPTGALNAHNLYLETLAELGPLGLALLVVTLAVPLVLVVRRRSPLAAVAAGAYATFLAHAAVDWDWQMPAVTVAGLLCGICALRTASADERPSPRALRPALALAAVVALAVAAAGIGNAELSAAARGRSAEAARAAAALQPWSAAPRRLLGELALARGDRAQARRFLAAAIVRDPDDAASWYDLVLAGTPAQREAAAARLAQLDPLAVSRRVVARGSSSPRASRRR